MPEHPHKASLIATAAQLCRPGRGILAADESPSTIGKRLTSYNLPNEACTRRAFREILITAPDNESAYSGIILFPETLYQKSASGKPFIETLNEKGILPGVKVDTGLQPLPGRPEETFTKGIDGLQDRCRQYFEDGARFAKWRAALRINEEKGLPSGEAVERNADELAEYAQIAQGAGLVPIVEPEILIDGKHTQAVSASVAKRVITVVYSKLRERGVLVEGTLLKPMMILPGIDSGVKSSAEEVARVTLATMKEVVPAEVAGIMFLSGGMGEAEATRNLAALNRVGKDAPWRVSFSFGRALQTSVMECWRGRDEMRDEAKGIAAQLGLVNAKATLGVYEGHPYEGGAGLYEGFRGWRGEEKA